MPISPKMDTLSRKFWDSVAEVAREVQSWPSWKRGGQAKDAPTIGGVWQPIDSAPLNQQILVCAFDTFDGKLGYDRIEWVTLKDRTMYYDHNAENHRFSMWFTHWQPLPDPAE